ncbi:unnamed protein product [marine sediment metagenome]|uniref:Uncharacterized protein n=1 Tax=marine sediment metagenome TaxID=412755 RepID=X1BMT3_9ZZZZ
MVLRLGGWVGIGKDGDRVSFKGCDDVLPPQMFLSLKDDGDMAMVVFVGEPVPREEQFRKVTRYRYYFPVVTKEGLQVWGVGSRTYRVLRDGWSDYLKKGFTVTRHGAAGSTDTSYELESDNIPVGIGRMVADYAKKDIDKFVHDIQVFGEEPD